VIEREVLACLNAVASSSSNYGQVQVALVGRRHLAFRDPLMDVRPKVRLLGARHRKGSAWRACNLSRRRTRMNLQEPAPFHPLRP